MHSDNLTDAIASLVADGLIDDVLYPVKSGKEATLYCCRSGSRLEQELVAVKVFKPQKFRSFRNDSAYQAGRVILDSRAARAAAKRTRFGREVQSSETLRLLHRAGAQVPQPLGHTEGAIAMEWIGDADGPAPQLKDVELDHTAAQGLFEQLIADVELWLACNIVHGDLSAYNLLYASQRIVAIDFPQASDPRFNLNAETLLARDIRHVCQHFARYGVRSEPDALTNDLWDRFLSGEL